MKTANIKKLAFDHTWSNDYGTNYDHLIEFDNGDSGMITTKTEQPPFKVGDSLSYDILPPAKKGKPNKIKRVNPKFQNGTQSTPNVPISEVIEQRIEKLEEVVKQLVKHTKMAYVAPKPQKVISPANVTTMEEQQDDFLPF